MSNPNYVPIPFELREETQNARIERTDPCRRDTRRWKACDTPVTRFRVNPHWIGAISDVTVRDTFLSSCCAVDRHGNAWFPKWCITHTRETLTPSNPELDLWDSTGSKP